MPQPVPRTVESRVCDESGIALVLALVCMVALGTAVTSITYYATQNFRQSGQQRSGQSALALAEAGLNLAYSTLENASNPGSSSAVSASPVPDVPLADGFATYYGAYNATTQVWTLYGIGKAWDPARPGRLIVRRVSGRARIGSASVGGANNAVWNYVYADSTATCTSIGNSVNVNVPFYVKGNLCMSNSAIVTSYALEVGGTLTMNSPGNSVGLPASPMREAHIGGGCSTDGVRYTKPCGPSQRVYAQISDSTPVALSKPPVDLAGTAQNAELGPAHGCTVGSLPWGGFDRDTNPLNVSLGTIDLVPTRTTYDCKALDSSGNVVGRLAWDGRTLTVAGTIYLDANISFGQRNNVVYDGKATIYASGTISVAQYSTLCPVAACDSTWDVRTDLLAWVSGKACPGTGVGIANNSTFQGAIYAVCDYTEGNGATVWGPIVANQIYLQNSTVNHYVPIGTLLPGMPSTEDQVQTIVPEPGSWGG